MFSLVFFNKYSSPSWLILVLLPGVSNSFWASLLKYYRGNASKSHIQVLKLNKKEKTKQKNQS